MKAEEHYRSGSFDWTIVKDALRRALPSGAKPSWRTGVPVKNRDVEISVLINDVFGGEILRKGNGRSWQFYNRINDECVDLAGQEETSSCDDSAFKKYSDAPANSSGNFEQNDYSTLFLRFVTAFEETVGLGKYQIA
ncbi:MAG: hypothetical protein P1P83_08085 [Bacteroidales bacterium]|nr:hypothetical protein [Bacteroidales bacterium]MDT8373514.1 hypothetical protein [Bacteroidales bacterium]